LPPLSTSKKAVANLGTAAAPSNPSSKILIPAPKSPGSDLGSPFFTNREYDEALPATRDAIDGRHNKREPELEMGDGFPK
jgi:hypothetical protein